MSRNRRHRRLEKIGDTCFWVGFLGVIVVSGEDTTLTLGQWLLWCACSLSIMGLGTYILNRIGGNKS